MSTLGITILFWAVLLKFVGIGVLDLLEYSFFNEKVFHMHNFPDIVPFMVPGYFAAFVSGILCAIILPLVDIIVLVIFGFCLEKRRNQLVFLGCSIIALASGITVMMVDKFVYSSLFCTEDPFYYHKWFYAIFGVTEFLFIVFGILLVIQGICEEILKWANNRSKNPRVLKKD